MSDHGIVTEARAVRFERVLPGPIERVWAYLTESEKRGKWLATGEMDLRVGGATTLTFRNADLSPQTEPTPERFRKYENGVSTHGRITRCDPPRLLSFTWDEQDGEGSEVTFELTPRGETVLLVLTHRRLRSRTEMLNVSGGWHTHLDILSDHLRGAEPKPFWSTFARREAEYADRIPAE